MTVQEVHTDGKRHSVASERRQKQTRLLDTLMIMCWCEEDWTLSTVSYLIVGVSVCVSEIWRTPLMLFSKYCWCNVCMLVHTISCYINYWNRLSFSGIFCLVTSLCLVKCYLSGPYRVFTLALSCLHVLHKVHTFIICWPVYILLLYNMTQ